MSELSCAAVVQSGVVAVQSNVAAVQSNVAAVQSGAAAVQSGAAVVLSDVAAVLLDAATVQSENVAAGDSGSYSIERKRAGVWVCSWLLQRDVGVLRRIQFIKKVGTRIVQVYFLLRLSRDDKPAAFQFVQ